jgi:aspartyl aminopeptidase
MSELVADLIRYIDRSPTPYHAVAETAARLRAANYRQVEEDEVWAFAPGDRRFIVRNEGSLIAFEVGEGSPADAGFRIVGAHTDSPNLRLKPRPDLDVHGYRQLGVEPYGGVLLHTWLDRDLTLAGRVSIATPEGVSTELLDLGRPLLRVPSLAIHLHREVNREGLKLDPQRHLVPVVGLKGVPSLLELIVSELREQGVAVEGPASVLGFDLMASDTQGAAVSGAAGEFLHAPRLDNLASCHAGLLGLLRAGEGGQQSATRVLALYDHEEVGSRSAQGAAGPILEDTLARIVEGFQGGAPQGLARAVALSTLVSADMAHAVHPNFSERHEPSHRPEIGRGPVIKVNANQAYATDSATAAVLTSLCRGIGFEPQHFVTRSDLACGSTIGPITAARLGIRTVDVGNPMLSMHSCREMAGTADVAPMIELLAGFYRS